MEYHKNILHHIYRIIYLRNDVCIWIRGCQSDMLFADILKYSSSHISNVFSKKIYNVLQQQPIAIANAVTRSHVQPMNVVVLRGIIFLTMITFGFTLGYLW